MLPAYGNHQKIIDKNYRCFEFPENEDLLSMKSRVWVNLTNWLAYQVVLAIYTICFSCKWPLAQLPPVVSALVLSTYSNRSFTFLPSFPCLIQGFFKYTI